jgi:hypothetical protein
MTLSLPARAAAVVVLSLSLLTGIAQADGQGGGQPPKTKKQCLRILKAGQHDLAAERKAYPARKKAALAKVTSQRAKLATLTAQHDAIAPQMDAIMNTNTDGLTESDIDAMNAKIEALTQQQLALQTKVDEAVGKLEEAIFTAKTLADRYRDDMKNWPGMIKQVKSYCSKM